MAPQRTPHRIILDCDPGQDDALAMLLALASPDEIELLAVTAVAGNVPLALTEKNARKVLELAARTDIPVYKGCHRPLVETLETAEYVHGKTGLNGVELPEPSVALAPGHAVDAIIDIVMTAAPKSVTLCPTGPLTNVAMAMLKEPELAPRLKAIVLMGGAIGLGNVTPAAEFNIYVDPHAAKLVFESGVPLTMLGLDVTHRVLVNRPRLEAIRAIGTPVGLAAAGLVDFFNRFDSDRYAADGAPLHDPCVIAWLIDPTLFSGKPCHVAIETVGSSKGRTNVDWFPREHREPNAMVIDQVDSDRFFALLIERLARH
jgi:purine nucleosidase